MDLRVINHDDLVRRRDSKAVVNRDVSSLNKYRQERDRMLKLQRVVEDTDKLKEDVADIKSMLRQLLENKK
jgi:hypothetical protein